MSYDAAPSPPVPEPAAPPAPPAPPGPLGRLAPPPLPAVPPPRGRFSTRAPPCACAAPCILLTIPSAGLFCSSVVVGVDEAVPVAAACSVISPSSGAGRLSDWDGEVGVAGDWERVALTAAQSQLCPAY